MGPVPSSAAPGAAAGARGRADARTGAPASKAFARVRLSLSQRAGLALMLLIALLVLGAFATTVWSTRSVLRDLDARRDTQSAHALAAMLAQMQRDPAAAERLLGGHWSSGAYRSLRYRPADTEPGFDRSAAEVRGAAPAWFIDALDLEPEARSAPVTAGGHALGQVELAGATAATADRLWETTLAAAMVLAGLGLLATLAGGALLARLRAALAPALEQARVLAAGRCATAEVPAVAPEMQLLTQAMNTMVDRLRSAVDVQVAQVEQLRRQAHLDASTGLANRRHFLAELDAALQREDGTAQSGLLLLRLRDLPGLNRTLGHAAGDRAIAALAQALATYAECVPGSFAGRLNGADFALCLPVGGMVLETAQTLATAMRAVLPSIGAGVTVALGGAELSHGMAAAAALARVDEALARAELRGPFAVEALGRGRASAVAGGETAWRKAIDTALTAGCANLAEFPLVDAQGALIHLEAPLRLQLQSEGAYESAATWLPLAARTRMTGAVDARAVALALEAIARDGRPRSINLAPASLGEEDFASRLRALLFAAPRAARRLVLEVDEAAAVERFAPLRDLARLVRPCGVRLGLEHAGRHLATIEHLFEDWLDFVKLDASVGAGAAGDAQRAAFVHAAVGLLHGLSIDVHAEGVRSDEDAAALWACGVDGITGPWATARFAHPR